MVSAAPTARKRTVITISDFWIIRISDYATVDTWSTAMPKSLHSQRHLAVAAAVANARRAAGMTQAQVAKAMGRHQPFVANIESGERRVDVIELLDIASVVRLDVSTLIVQLASMKD